MLEKKKKKSKNSRHFIATNMSALSGLIADVLGCVSIYFLWVFWAFFKLVKYPQVCRWKESSTLLFFEFYTLSSQMYFSIFEWNLTLQCFHQQYSVTVLVLTSWRSASLLCATNVRALNCGWPFQVLLFILLLSHFIMLLWVELHPTTEDMFKS